MRYNPNSPFEKAPNECPRRCEECAFYKADTDESGGGTCTANECRRHTYGFHRPTDCPLPLPLNCYWWYISNVWDRVSVARANEYREERLHEMVTFKMLETLEGKERHAFIDHVHRPGGGGIIDFAIYPQAKPIYEELKAREQGEKIKG